jgi:hypothetical protein
MDHDMRLCNAKGGTQSSTSVASKSFVPDKASKKSLIGMMKKIESALAVKRVASGEAEPAVKAKKAKKANQLQIANGPAGLAEDEEDEG